MKTLLLFSLFLFLQSSAVAQLDSIPELGNKQITQHATYFNIEKGEFRDADSLQNVLASAHFVALGELHNRVRLGEFTEALLQNLHALGFKNMAVETGPYSAEKLEQLIESGENAVTDFYDRYSSKLFNIYPIPFFTGEGDLNFLSTADSLDYDLWGLDQEFAYSFKYLVDELASLNKNQLTTNQEELRDQISSKLYWWNRRSKIFSGFGLSCRLQEYQPLQSYLESFEDEGHFVGTDQIIEAIHTSLRIYCMAESGKASSRERINYFKQNFDRHYQTALENDPDARVFIKMGSFHAGRQKSPIGLYDIGNHIHQLADSTGKKSVHIRYLNRFYKGEDMIGKDGWQNSTHFMSAGSRDEWTLIDLRPLRRLIVENALQGSDYEEREIHNYDFIVIPPEDKMVKKHY